MRRSANRCLPIGPRRPRRRQGLGAGLALLGLLLQLLLPDTAALAGGIDPLAAAPICTTGPHPASAPVDGQAGHKALHAACPICQGQAVAWGFLPPDTVGVARPRQVSPVIWSAVAETAVAAPCAAPGARGPPRAA